MSFPPIDPSSFRPHGMDHSSFRAPSSVLDLAPLSQPESDPSVVMDIDNSVAIDQVRALLDTDFTESRAAWIHLLMSLITDACNGLLSSIQRSSLQRFSNLSPSERSHLTFLKRSIESLDTFFADTQDDPEEWITCMGCATSFQLPVSKDDWDACLSACSGDIAEACNHIVDEAVAAAHLHMQSWVDGERISAQAAAINSLASDHAPDISEVISDPHLIEWSCRLLEVMKHHFTESLVTEATHTLPAHLSDCLDAERQAKLDTARSDARAEAKRLYHAKLQRLQSDALAEASRDFEHWKTTTLIPEWQSKEAAAKAEKLRELDTFKHGIAIEMEEHKENARIVAAKSLVHSKTEHRSRRQERRANPIQASRSVSHVRSPSPSPSQKLDKTPTKADFPTVSQTTSVPPCAPVSDHARGRARPSVAQEVSEPFSQTSEITSAKPILDVMMAPAAPSGDACPSLARPSRVIGTGIVSTTSAPPPEVPLVECYQSVTLSPTPPPTVETVETAEDRMMRLLGSTITAALVPLKSSMEDISARLHMVEETQNWSPDDEMPEDYDPKTHGYAIPTVKPKLGDEEHVDYHVVSALSQAADEDAEMEEAQAAYAEQDQDDHPYFETVILRTRSKTRDQMDPDKLKALASGAAEAWEDFCFRLSIPRLVLPPSAIADEAFVKSTRIYLAQAQLEDEFTCAARVARGSTVSTAPGYTGPNLPLSLHPTHTRASEPISISSDATTASGLKISGFTELSPPAPAARYQGTGGVFGPRYTPAW